MIFFAAFTMIYTKNKYISVRTFFSETQYISQKMGVLLFGNMSKDWTAEAQIMVNPMKKPLKNAELWNDNQARPVEHNKRKDRYGNDF